MRVIFALLLIVQLLDMAVHVFTNQAEPTRIASNLILGLGALFAARALGIGLAAWVLLGSFAGYFWQREGARSA